MGRHHSPPSDGVADVRRAVLDGALDIIATQGPEAVSMREVARRAGVSHQAPYHYFGDRAGIFAAIAEEGFRLFTEDFRLVLSSSDDVATSCLHAYVRFALTHKGHFRVMFRSDICGITTHERTHNAADDAFLALLDLADAVNSTRSPSQAMVLPIALWAQAHGLATLLVDGTLMDKLPPETDLHQLIQSIALLTPWSHNEKQH